MNYGAAATLAFNLTNNNVDSTSVTAQLQQLLPLQPAAQLQELADKLRSGTLAHQLDQVLLMGGTPDGGGEASPLWK